MRNKRYVTLLILTLIIGCDTDHPKEEVKQTSQATLPEQVGEEIELDDFFATKISAKEYELSELANNPFVVDLSLVKSSKNELRLLKDDKTEITIHDSIPNDEASVIIHTCLGYNKSINQYLIVREYYEDEDVILVNKSNGSFTTIWNRPIVNKKGDLLFNKQSNLCMMYEDTPHGFQIWEYDSNTLTKTEEVELTDNTVLDGKWTNTGDLLIKLTSIDNYINKGGTPTTGIKYYKISKK